MCEKQRVQHLVVDTSAFIRNAALQDIGVDIVTEQDVINEITNKRQLRRLVVLPYDLSVQNAFPENIQFVTEFAKKTGDYTSLSATDIKVIALTYQLEKEKVGTDHLRTSPIVAQTVDSRVQQAKDLCEPLAGFYMPDRKSKSEANKKNNTVEELAENTDKNEEEISSKEKEDEESEVFFSDSCDKSKSDYETADSDVDCDTSTDLSDKFTNLNCKSAECTVENDDNADEACAFLKVVPWDNYESYDEDDEDEDENDDDSGWITPRNLSTVKKEIDSEILEEKPATVACLTMDFAMQNVLKQIGLNVAALDGRVIKQMRTFIFRCHACFKTTSVMTKVFCPSCGNKTLKKVAVSLNKEGNQQIHINFRKPISKKGKKFSLPTPQGGKHANNPILCADQPLPDQRSTRLARTKNDPLQDDYIAGYSPFIMRDVNSKSAMLGIRPGGTVKYWMKKNPNERRRKRK